jgi:hypothetical protein
MYAIAITPDTPSSERIDYLMRANAKIVKYWYDKTDTVYISASLETLSKLLNVVPSPTVQPLWYEVPFRPTGPVMYEYDNLKPINDPR